MSIHISKRLASVAAHVPAGARVIDVGTDHAMVPVWLIQEGIASHVFACDIRPGPLQGAARLIEETGTEQLIELRLTDGLSGLCREDGDTVIIAGMGGETIVSILSAAPWTKQDVTLILEPQSKQAVLRRFLLENGYSIDGERLVEDAGRIYPILTASGGECAPYSETELHTGKYDILRNDPLFPAFLEPLISRTASAAPFDPSAKDLLEGLILMKKELFA